MNMPNDNEVIAWIFYKIGEGILWLQSYFFYRGKRIEKAKDDDLVL
jgi:hypothetical protein